MFSMMLVPEENIHIEVAINYCCWVKSCSRTLRQEYQAVKALLPAAPCRLPFFCCPCCLDRVRRQIHWKLIFSVIVTEDYKIKTSSVDLWLGKWVSGLWTHYGLAKLLCACNPKRGTKSIQCIDSSRIHVWKVKKIKKNQATYLDTGL